MVPKVVILGNITEKFGGCLFEITQIITPDLVLRVVLTEHEQTNCISCYQKILLLVVTNIIQIVGPTVVGQIIL